MNKERQEDFYLHLYVCVIFRFVIIFSFFPPKSVAPQKLWLHKT